MSATSVSSNGRPEVWGGIEGTVNRVGDRYFDQMRRSGHWERIEDLELIAALGIQALRYPVLWEHIAPLGPKRADWTWPDARLRRLRQLGVRPIVGLVHHGSGPRHTSLVDPAFPFELAKYARAVAERYPWVEDYTPVNEPLTTGRFSGLYGHWYPHGKDYTTFARTMVVQCRAIVEAMRAIREVTPGARLIQTEDMGRTYSTPHLAYQAEFENHRRWLSLDLLCGRIDRNHPLWHHLQHWGVCEKELGWFLDNPMPPDVVGLNYYITSDRLLDERMEHYPAWSHGGNHRDAYADVHVAGVWKDAISGHRDVLAWAWERYRLPVALTEVHLGCTREDQLRWLAEAWEAACSLRAEGVDVRALTVWSLLGTYDWNTLVTADRGFYEPGVFDIRAPRPRPTALARMTHALATRGDFEHPVLASPGWWRRTARPEANFAASLHGDSRVPYVTYVPARRAGSESPRPVLISGATGTLGRAFARLCRNRGIAFQLLSRQEMDIASLESVERAIERFQPWAIINAAGYVRVDDAEMNAARCFRENTLGPEVLATACGARGVRLVTFSSDLVFGGERNSAYLESCPVQPLNQYGRSKVEAERRVLERMPEALVVRTGAFFGPWDRHNFVTLALGTLANGDRFAAADDVVVSPTYVPDLVHTCLDLLLDEASGVWHLTNAGEVTWAELARQAASLMGLNPRRVDGRPLESFGWSAPRPRYSALSSERAQLMPPLTKALERYLEENEIKPARRAAGGGRAVCAECGGTVDEGHGDGRCGLHRERGDGGVAAGG
ncbi:sugar nucleotide-binding protein [Archangium violaceum]|uniref:family 1 glycosylhydrolase n=1 Tax=Archangium violaceum TaxID=83451 RepID=UPI002B28CAE4|nr:sugar nucleotide-binding protein [Archangium violaceum]